MLQKGADSRLKEQGLILASQCLSYDFVGTCLDDSSEEICTIQIPSAWRPVVEEASTLQLLLDYYKTTSPPLSNVALECLVRSWGCGRREGERGSASVLFCFSVCPFASFRQRFNRETE